MKKENKIENFWKNTIYKNNKIDEKQMMKEFDKEIYDEAKKDFEAMIKNSTKKEIRSSVSGYGIYACKWARQYTTSEKNLDLYKKIYNIFYNYFKTYDKTNTTTIK